MNTPPFAPSDYRPKSDTLTVYPVNGEYLQDGEYENDEPASVVVDEGEDKLTSLDIIKFNELQSDSGGLTVGLA